MDQATQTCALWLNGNCPFGAACMYAHYSTPMSSDLMDVSSGGVDLAQSMEMLNSSQDGNGPPLELTWGQVRGRGSARFVCNTPAGLTAAAVAPEMRALADAVLLWPDALLRVARH